MNEKSPLDNSKKLIRVTDDPKTVESFNVGKMIEQAPVERRIMAFKDRAEKISENIRNQDIENLSLAEKQRLLVKQLAFERIVQSPNPIDQAELEYIDDSITEEDFDRLNSIDIKTSEIKIESKKDLSSPSPVEQVPAYVKIETSPENTTEENKNVFEDVTSDGLENREESLTEQIKALNKEEYEKKKNVGVVEQRRIEEEFKIRRRALRNQVLVASNGKDEKDQGIKTLEENGEKPEVRDLKTKLFEVKNEKVKRIGNFWKGFKEKIGINEKSQEGQKVIKKELPQWTKEELEKAGLSEEEQQIYGELTIQIVNNKNLWERFSVELSGRKVFGIGADAMVGFAGGVLGRSAVRSFVKYSIGWIAGAGTGVLAGAGVGGTFGYLRSRSAAQKIEYDASNWSKIVQENENDLEGIKEAVKDAIKQSKVKGDRETATKLVLQLRQIDILMNSKNKSALEVLQAKNESEEKNPVLEVRKQELLNKILNEKDKNIKKAAIKGAWRGAVTGAVGGALAGLFAEAFSNHDSLVGYVGDKVRSAWDSVRENMPSFGETGQEELVPIPSHQPLPEELDKFISPDSSEKVAEQITEGKEAAGVVTKEVFNQAVDNHQPLPDHIIMEKGDNVWNLTREYLRGVYHSSGYSYEPSDAQIMEASKVIAVNNDIEVKIWNIEGHTSDIKLPVGKDLDYSALKPYMVEHWGLEVNQNISGSVSGSAQLLEKISSFITEPGKRAWLSISAALLGVVGVGLIASDRWQKNKQRKTTETTTPIEQETANIQIEEPEEVTRSSEPEIVHSDLVKVKENESRTTTETAEISTELNEPVLVKEFKYIDTIMGKRQYSRNEINKLKKQISAKNTQDVKDSFDTLSKLRQKTDNSAEELKKIADYIEKLAKAHKLNQAIKLPPSFYTKILKDIGRNS